MGILATHLTKGRSFSAAALAVARSGLSCHPDSFSFDGGLSTSCSCGFSRSTPVASAITEKLLAVAIMLGRCFAADYQRYVRVSALCTRETRGLSLLKGKERSLLTLVVLLRPGVIDSDPMAPKSARQINAVSPFFRGAALVTELPRRHATSLSGSRLMPCCCRRFQFFLESILQPPAP